MSLTFEWDLERQRPIYANIKSRLLEATTVFNDPFGAAVSDPDHSNDEDRFILVGQSNRQRLLIIAFTERAGRIRIISARLLTESEGNSMKNKATELNDELRPEYDLNQLLKGAVRGKYVQQYQEGTNLVLLEPDVAEAFPTPEAVNKALRLVMQLSQIPSSH